MDWGFRVRLLWIMCFCCLNWATTSSLQSGGLQWSVKWLGQEIALQSWGHGSLIEKGGVSTTGWEWVTGSEVEFKFLVEEKVENWQRNWCSVCSNLDVLPVCCSEWSCAYTLSTQFQYFLIQAPNYIFIKCFLKSEAVSLLSDHCSHLHLKPRAVGSDQKIEIKDTGSRN